MIGLAPEGVFPLHDFRQQRIRQFRGAAASPDPPAKDNEEQASETGSNPHDILHGDSVDRRLAD